MNDDLSDRLLVAAISHEDADAANAIRDAIDEIDRLRAALVDAIDSLEQWGGYASDYEFEVSRDVARLKAVIDGDTP